jgi:hypothetical protein
MSLLHPARAGTVVTLLLVNGQPVQLLHDGRPYVVTDMPTRLEDEMAVLTHPLPIAGWRFQGTDALGVSRMFDVRQVSEGWVLVRTYD